VEIIDMGFDEYENERFDGRYYDLQTRDRLEDIAFFKRQVKKYGEPVLELGCGTGRITIPIAEDGIRITGLDISEIMLSRAREKAAEKGTDIEWIKADWHNFKLNKKFNVILLPFNSISLIYDLKRIEAFFSCVKEHLSESGRFVIDFFNPRFDFLVGDKTKNYHVADYPNPDGKGVVTITQDSVYDASTQINKIKRHYKIGEEEYTMDLDVRVYFPQELDSLLHYNGFEIEAKYGNYDEEPFASESQIQLIVCRKRN